MPLTSPLGKKKTLQLVANFVKYKSSKLKGTAYLLQASFILLWWIGLSLNATFYQAFQFPEIGPKAFNSFFAPDIFIVALLSIIRAYKDLRELEFVILGGFAFGTLYCINASILTGGGYLPTTLMILGLLYNLFLMFQANAFRVSQSQSFAINGLKTIVQIICIWFITLIFFPWLLIQAFEQAATFPIGMAFPIGLILLGLFGTLGLISAYTMVKQGKGTPLPIDQTTRLVLAGPYRYVRNPMAIAGIGQGMAISIMFMSIPIAIYTLIGAILWQFVVRPIEEKDLAARFGIEYENYKQKIPCWMPRFNQNRGGES